MPEGTQRRLAAIVSADVVGYSRLMGADETGTLEAMRVHRREVWDPTIEKYGGRVVNRAGDSALVEFGSAVAAMECSVAIQEAMAQRNADVPGDKRIELRVGVNIGEVVVEGEEIYGDGVNIAARLQTLALPGGIALSGNVQEQIRAKLNLALADDGEHTVKNIAHPVRVWRWSIGSPPAGATDTVKSAGADDEPLALPDKPSIAVLPFDNMSGDAGQEYFSDGISEDLTTALSRFSSLFVIARNSSFRYKGQKVDIKKVSQELGVRYILEGSVRRAGNRVRINAQLIDAADEHHVWAERYDRQIDDVFELQDDIVASIAAAVGPEITRAEIERARNRRPDTLHAWDYYLRAMSAFHKMTQDDVFEAIALLERAIEIEPDFSSAHAFLSLCHLHCGMYGWTRPARRAIDTALRCAEMTIRLAPSSPEGHYAHAFALCVNGQAENAIAPARRAIELNPNFAEAHGVLGLALTFSGDFHGGLEAGERAARSNPREAVGRHLYNGMGHAYFMLGDYEKAIEVSKENLHLDRSNYGAIVALSASYAMLGRTEEAQYYVNELLQVIPRFNLRALRKNPMFVQQEHIDKLVEAMRLAGVPE